MEIKVRWRKLKRKPLMQQNSKELHCAGFLERAKAQVIDTFMIYLPILYIIAYGIVGSAQGFRDSALSQFLAVLFYGGIVALFLAFKGQTPGKKAYNLWIVRGNGKEMTFFFALLRFFVFLLSGSSVIGILMPLWRKDKRALHDILLDTMVLKKG